MKKTGRRFLAALSVVMLAAGIFAGTGEPVKATEEPVEVISVTLDMPTKVPTGNIEESNAQIMKSLKAESSLGKGVLVTANWVKRAEETEQAAVEYNGKKWTSTGSQEFVPGTEYGVVVAVIASGVGSSGGMGEREISGITIKINGKVTKLQLLKVYYGYAVLEINGAGIGNSPVEMISPGEPQAPEQGHTHSYSWVTVQEASAGQDGIEEYRCSCGAVADRSIIPASSALVKGFCDSIKNASQNGVVQFDSGRMYTLSDRMVKALAERSDVTMVVTFTYEGKAYKMTIPAGTDYTVLLTDEEEFYGYFYFAKMVGAVIEEC